MEVKGEVKAVRSGCTFSASFHSRPQAVTEPTTPGTLPPLHGEVPLLFRYRYPQTERLLRQRRAFEYHQLLLAAGRTTAIPTQVKFLPYIDASINSLAHLRYRTWREHVTRPLISPHRLGTPTKSHTILTLASTRVPTIWRLNLVAIFTACVDVIRIVKMLWENDDLILIKLLLLNI